MEERQEVVEYAGFWVRFAAFFIDVIILVTIGGIIGLIIGLIGQRALTGEGWVGFAMMGADKEELATFLVSLRNLIWSIIDIAYCVCFWAWRGQTPGKIALRIKIIRTDGSSIGLGGAILRYVGYIISRLIFMIGYLWIAFDHRKQGIHDKIADTYVIRLPRKRVRLPEIYG